jgi:ABC-type nitrate/sulfonate/bicarbonate transport system ATPase subunit
LLLIVYRLSLLSYFIKKVLDFLTKYCYRIDLQIKKGELIAVVGPVGSGKSSLLAACMGEMETISGDISLHVSFNIAMVLVLPHHSHLRLFYCKKIMANLPFKYGEMLKRSKTTSICFQEM